LAALARDRCGSARRHAVRDTPWVISRDTSDPRRREMILATAKVGDFDRFWNTFSTKGAEKRRQHGSKGAQVLRDPNDDDRIWVVFDWDEEGWQSFISDPEVPAIFQEAGMDGRPEAAELIRQHDA
jgi:heme-degrading monooxygenase HmoA